MKKKVVLAGGTGFIGQYFAKKFEKEGYEIHIISRQAQHLSWNDQTAIVKALDGAELLINLAGKSVNCRYNEANKKAIMDSRTETTTILGEAIMACDTPPKVWMNSSTATIYRHADDRPMTEDGGEIGSGFSVDVATTWEETFFSFDLSSTRQIALRIAIVLGKDGGVMTPYLNLVKFGLGGIQGSGRQMFSWIHVEDLFQIVLFLRGREDLTGVFNCAAPEPVSNRELMSQLRTTMNARFGLPAPKWMLELGSVFLRTETELVLKSRWVIPKRLEREGFIFTYPTLRETLENIINE
ncbi:TIGR01777 family oxidoreductase [Alkalihalophilus lindianensis]|uniref:TIGR01777 family oxidoreductase n=1 Tax=Alkalihalophilus lindianensis TaxID=1630542 RepID=A0ABU3X4X8_9BACI|nr:TIGR01777 family oxidoreductase [Alkalihalophilus lindianensis]MDV2682932.1 TIGR01777 family oxidoreductase [Alkalihalophilus lindianensis]